MLGVEVVNLDEGLARSLDGGLGETPSGGSYAGGCQFPRLGVLILAVERASPAARAGLTGIVARNKQYTGADGLPMVLMYGGGVARGDAITSLDGNPITDNDVLMAELAQHAPGDQVTVGYVNCQGGTGTVTVRLAAGP